MHRELATEEQPDLREAARGRRRPARDPGPGEPVVRFPMSAAEEIFAPDNRDGPASMQFELRVAGSLDEDRLREAIAAAVAAHPMTRARVVAPRRLLRPPQWELGEPDLDEVLASVPCADEAGMTAIRDEYYSRPLGLSSAPALRGLLVRRPGGDSLLFNIHHSIMDGMGALRWINSVARAYTGRPDPIPDVDPIAARDMRFMNVARGASSPEVMTPKEPGGPVAQVAGERAPDQPGYGIRQRALSAEECALLNPCLYGPDATLNDLMMAALHLTIGSWNADHGRPAEWVSVLFPANIRPAEWSGEVVGNLAIINRNFTSPGDRATPEALMAAVTAQTRPVRAGIAALKYFARPAWARWLISNVIFPLFLYRPAVIPRRVKGHIDSILFASLGRVEKRVSDFGPGAGKLTEFWVSPPVVMPMGIGLDSALLRGRLHLSLRYRRALIDARDAEGFLDRVVETLKALGRGPA